MPAGGDDPLEEQILRRFFENITSNTEISEDIVEVINDVSEEADFGGRDTLTERALEVINSNAT